MWRGRVFTNCLLPPSHKQSPLTPPRTHTVPWPLNFLCASSTYLPMQERGGIRNKAAGQKWLENGILMNPPTFPHTQMPTHNRPMSRPLSPFPEYGAAKYRKYQYGTDKFRLINTVNSFLLCVYVSMFAYVNLYVCIGLHALWGLVAAGQRLRRLVLSSGDVLFRC